MGLTDYAVYETAGKVFALIPDFSKYSLVLVDGDQVIHASRESGLKPLWDALETFQTRRGLLLHDKVIGLAAARLIVISGVIASVRTLVASRPAKLHLEQKGILFETADTADHILTRDRSAVCPGEQIALAQTDDEAFVLNIRAMLFQSR